MPALKNMLDLMSKFLAMGMPLDEVIAANHLERRPRSHQAGAAWDTCRWARAADVAVLRVDKGNFGFPDQTRRRVERHQRLRCELTLRDGKVVYDLNGLTGDEWDKLPADYRGLGDPRWDGITEGGGGRGGRGEGPASPAAGRGRGEGTGRGGAR